VSPGDRVVIKPNFVSSRNLHERITDLKLQASSTHGSLLRPVIDYALRAAGPRGQVRVVDREGKGVAGLAGRLLVVRPSDQRLSQSAPLVGLPQEPGRYRALVVVDQPGAWEFRIDARQGELRFVHAARVDVAPDPGAGEIR
jgi:nitrogen fixation protein FixH